VREVQLDILTHLQVFSLPEHENESRDSSVGIATGYGVTTKGSEFEFPWGQEFSLLHVVQTGSGVHPASYPMGTGGSLPGGKAAGADQSPPTSAEVKKNMDLYIHSPYAFMA
jgi:hypothetical protein